MVMSLTYGFKQKKGLNFFKIVYQNSVPFGSFALDLIVLLTATLVELFAGSVRLTAGGINQPPRSESR